jgi:L-methionine (R)-S-oxide reductase
VVVKEANTSESDLEVWLREFVQRRGAVAGTVHVHEGGELLLAAALNIPEPVRRATERIPRGKGMAGLALDQDRPIATCNLQTGSSADVRPGARAVDARAAVALPVHDSSGGIRAVVGIAWAEERELDDELLASLSTEAAGLPR